MRPPAPHQLVSNCAINARPPPSRYYNHGMASLDCRQGGVYVPYGFTNSASPGNMPLLPGKSRLWRGKL